MAQKPIPRRSPGVSVRVGKSTRNADTRDARDDATIIAWLQRIDMDVLKASTKPVVASNQPPPPGSSPSGSSPSGSAPSGGTSPSASAVRTPNLGSLEQQVRALGVALTAFTNAADFARKATIALGVALHPASFRGIVAGAHEGLRRLAGLALPGDVTRLKAESLRADQVAREAAANVRPLVTRYQLLQSRLGRQQRLAGRYRKMARRRPIATNIERAGIATARARKMAADLARQKAQATKATQLAQTTAKTAQAVRGMVPKVEASAAAPLLPALASGIGSAIAAAGPAAPIVGAAVAIVAATAAIIASVPLLKTFAESIFEANRSLAEFSPMMAIVMARAQIADTMRGIQTGQAVAPSAGKLQEALAELKDALQPLTISIRILANIFAIGLAKIATFLTSVVFAPITRILAEIAKKMDDLISKGNVDAVGLAEWATDIAQETTRRRGFGPLPSQRRNP